PVHRRRITVMDQQVCIRDWIEGAGVHAARGFFPIHPGVSVERTAENCFRLTSPASKIVRMIIDGAIEITLASGRFARGFGVTAARPSIEWRSRQSLPILVQTGLTVQGE